MARLVNACNSKFTYDMYFHIFVRLKTFSNVTTFCGGFKLKSFQVSKFAKMIFAFSFEQFYFIQVQQPIKARIKITNIFTTNPYNEELAHLPENACLKTCR